MHFVYLSFSVYHQWFLCRQAKDSHMTKLNKCRNLNLALLPSFVGNNHHLLFNFHLNACFMLSLFGLHFINPQFTYKFAYVLVLKFMCLSSLMKCLLTCKTSDELKEPYKSTFQVSKGKKGSSGLLGLWDTANISTILIPSYSHCILSIPCSHMLNLPIW